MAEKRPKKPLTRKKSALTEQDIRYATIGECFFTGDHSRLEIMSPKMQEKFYWKYREVLLEQVGTAGGEDTFLSNLYWGQRGYFFYKFEFGQDLSHLYFQFSRMKNPREAEFQWLKKEGKLLKNEEKLFKIQEKKIKEDLERLRLNTRGPGPAKVVDFPKKEETP